jgi:ADP-ribose pyrophosphatase YjhB (NUDIX family)
MIRAAGCVFISKSTKRVLLNFRSEDTAKPNCFGFWGGKLHTDESILEGLTREVIEELGMIPEYERIIILDEFTSPDGRFKYYSFAVIVTSEFIPILNEESQGYCWTGFDNYPKPLHPGAKAILENVSVKNSLIKLLNSHNGSNFPVAKDEENQE